MVIIGCTRGECMFSEDELLRVTAALEDQSNLAIAQKRSFLEYSIEFISSTKPDATHAKKTDVSQLNGPQKMVTQQLITLVNTIPNIKLLKGPEEQHNEWRVAREYRRVWPSDPFPLVNLSTLESKVATGPYPGGVQQLVRDLQRGAIQHGRRSGPGTQLWKAAQDLLVLLDTAVRDLHIGMEAAPTFSTAVYHARILSNINKETAAEQARIHHQKSVEKMAAFNDDYEAIETATTAEVDAAPKPKRPSRAQGTASARPQILPLSDDEIKTMNETFKSLEPSHKLETLETFPHRLEYNSDIQSLEFGLSCSPKDQRFILDFIRRMKDEELGICRSITPIPSANTASANLSKSNSNFARNNANTSNPGGLTSSSSHDQLSLGGLTGFSGGFGGNVLDNGSASLGGGGLLQAPTVPSYDPLMGGEDSSSSSFDSEDEEEDDGGRQQGGLSIITALLR